jgi:hypothetical protein
VIFGISGILFKYFYVLITLPSIFSFDFYSFLPVIFFTLSGFIVVFDSLLTLCDFLLWEFDNVLSYLFYIFIVIGWKFRNRSPINSDIFSICCFKLTPLLIQSNIFLNEVSNLNGISLKAIIAVLIFQESIFFNLDAKILKVDVNS